MKKTYILNPNMTFKSVNSTVASDKPAEAAVCRLPHKAVSLPPRQPLHTVTVDRNRTAIKLGLDVHLEFIMAVVQHDHQLPKAPRKFSPDQLITQVKEWIGKGHAVYCVQESCGFGFVLHRQLVGAGAQSLLITPIALNGRRKTDKLDARALCLRLSRYLEGNREELSPIRVPSPEEQRKREGTRRRQFLKREVRCLADRGHGQVAEYCHQKLAHRWWGTRNWKKLSAVLDAWLLGWWEKLCERILAPATQLDI